MMMITEESMNYYITTTVLSILIAHLLLAIIDGSSHNHDKVRLA